MPNCGLEKKMLIDALFKFHKLLSQKTLNPNLAAAAKKILEGPMRLFLRDNWQADFQRTGMLFTSGFFLAHSGIDVEDVDGRLLLTSVTEGLANLCFDPDWSLEDDGHDLKKTIRGYLKLNGFKLSQVESPAAQSDRVALFGQGKKLIQ